MGGTINGFGVIPISARGRLMWEPASALQHPWGIGACDYDGVVCVTVFFIPIAPLSCVHVHSREAAEGGGSLSERMRVVPLRWSLDLIARVFVTRWLLAATWLSAFSLIFQDTTERRACIGLFGVAWLAALVLFHMLDERNRAIRRVMGRSATGSSDPATWKDDMLRGAKAPSGGFGPAVRAALAKEQLGSAMRVARMAVALGNAAEGERLTDEVLAHPKVRAGLSSVGTGIAYGGPFPR